MERTKRGAAQAQEFGRRVRRQREALEPRLSQEALADRAGVHRTYVGHLERGEVNPTLWNIIRLADALEIDPGDLVRGLTSR